MPDTQGSHPSQGRNGMRPPAGFESQLFPLRHDFTYGVGLSMATATMNSCYLTLVKNYTPVTDATTIDVNPHHPNFVKDAGTICQPMSIIDRLTLTIRFNLTEMAKDTDKLGAVKFQWTPIFFSFPEKLDAADDKTTTTVAAILNLTKNATNEDVIPTLTATKLPIDGLGDLSQPLSTVNLAEVATTHLGMTTDATMQGVAHNSETFGDALRYYTNKGALKACMGRTRFETLTENRPNKAIFIKKFVPRPVRRMVPYAYFGILIHVPIASDEQQYYQGESITGSKAHLGIRLSCRYHEWHNDFNQKMVDQS